MLGEVAEVYEVDEYERVWGRNGLIALQMVLFAIALLFIAIK